MIKSRLRETMLDVLGAAKPCLRRILEQVVKSIASNKAQTAWGVATAALLYLNLKRIPFVWHFRVFSHIWWPKNGLFEHKPGAIFQPVVTPSRVALLETDYNLHKSNSTYFSDLDVARTDLLAALRAQAIDGDLYKEYKKGVQILLAGTSCTFKKEIKPGAAFDMQSRVLTWDKKWLYIVTHFVEKQKEGKSPTYKPWRKAGKGKDAQTSPLVYATAISKCVVKAGRLTVPPQKFFQAAGVLPSEDQPEGSIADVTPEANDFGGWTWAKVEEERLEALKIADGFASGLDAAHEKANLLV
ncbi:capsule polysaccharide biosynthesis protein [Colletotrichum scovillei]|uniref:Capsule polysaccharide biosynthesis protein n=1 Tax=Colletotrichum scovillei TaxID=1209932 RepID=A0A9P7R7C7_9PEZI|nr:capsule polysaccharide biosynthesis protein [Colletotrichum scovillei]KAF4782454.1 capsule polysaccharide biosynthesis protein [Colletotrichum scovillei]KAG7049829.1 capsule polysaccharide biosynthesis protein [Colletotrichum scovillei]KAG7068865.1 capsule polysaccharide biosynthesis protein [Colletotrichum scovillei]KAG7072821.1 capsule polysaccharide biosynthesis protein [Colletotrichum scovillei]